MGMAVGETSETISVLTTDDAAEALSDRSAMITITSATGIDTIDHIVCAMPQFIWRFSV